MLEKDTPTTSNEKQAEEIKMLSEVHDPIIYYIIKTTTKQLCRFAILKLRYMNGRDGCDQQRTGM